MIAPAVEHRDVIDHVREDPPQRLLFLSPLGSPSEGPLYGDVHVVVQQIHFHQRRSDDRCGTEIEESC